MRTLSFTAFVALLCAAPLVACSSADAPSSDPGEASEQDVMSSKKPTRAPACLAAGAQCDTAAADTCCAGTRCVEYTVYDWPRCRAPEPNGSFCYRHEQCASNYCDENNACAAAPACLAAGSKCDVAADTCCPGTECEEYTVYDWPRCRAPKR